MFRGESLPLGRFYPLITETIEEVREVVAFLEEQREQLVAPTLLEQRPSTIVSDGPGVWRYEPDAPGWPWITLFCWPAEVRELASGRGVRLSRGCYSIELFESRAAADDHDLSVLQQLDAMGEVRFLAGDQMPDTGHA